MSEQQAPERIWIHNVPQETKPCGCGNDIEYVRADIAPDTRVPGDVVALLRELYDEAQLTITSSNSYHTTCRFCDGCEDNHWDNNGKPYQCRPHEKDCLTFRVEVALNAATTPPVPDRLRDGDTYVDYERDPSTGEVFTVQKVAVAAPGDLISREAVQQLAGWWRDRADKAEPEVRRTWDDDGALRIRVTRSLADELDALVAALPAQPPVPTAEAVRAIAEEIWEREAEWSQELGFPLNAIEIISAIITRALSGKEE